MHHRRPSRPGFTLLEVILATTIAVLLLGALYVAVDMQLRYAQAARDLVEESTVARALMARMDADAAQVVGLSDPARFRFAAGLDKPDIPSATPPTTTPPANASTASTTTTATTATTATTQPTVPLGVMGDSQTLNLFVSSVPRELLDAGVISPTADQADAPPVVSDLRRVSYWLIGGDNAAGLARQEVALITSDDALQNLPPGIEDENSFLLADEVRSLTFQYFDGTDWQDSWDSTTFGADGVTPIGSPVAIAVTIGILPPGGNRRNGDVALKTYRHVLIIPSANGAAQATPNTTNGAMP